MTPKGQVGLPEEQRGWFNQTALNPVILDSVRENALAFCPPSPVEANSIDQDRLGTIEAQVEKSFLNMERKAGTLFTFDQLPWLAQLPPSSRSLRGKNI
eukprot:COSAG06_NODE_1591_length_8997_cov_166.390874_2_plen_99_part_00